MKSSPDFTSKEIPNWPVNRRTLLQSLLASALGALAAGCAGGDTRWDKEAKQLQELLAAETGEPGVYNAIGRLEIGNEVVFAGAAGTYSGVDKTPVRADTPFRAASVGKMFTAVAVLRLVEQGKLTLDMPLGGLLPSTLVDRLHVLDGVSRGPELTIRQLLGHTTGLANIDSDTTFNSAVALNPQRRW